MSARLNDSDGRPLRDVTYQIERPPASFSIGQ
jgi:hypothetical protein